MKLHVTVTQMIRALILAVVLVLGIPIAVWRILDGMGAGVAGAIASVPLGLCLFIVACIVLLAYSEGRFKSEDDEG
jgi:hypothetical protein